MRTHILLISLLMFALVLTSSGSIYAANSQSNPLLCGPPPCSDTVNAPGPGYRMTNTNVNAVGLEGDATNTGSGYNKGVMGTSQGSNGTGVFGYAQQTTGTNYGVYGYSASNVGVYGGGADFGVYGSPSTGGGIGVVGYASVIDGLGVEGISLSDSSIAKGVDGRIDTYSGGGDGVLGESYSSNPDSYGVYYVGGLGGTGGIENVRQTRDFGWRKQYAVQSTGNWTEDFGQGRLVDGKAIVKIEQIYAQVVNLSAGYHVFLTPLGDCQLYVAEKAATYFTVRASGGQSCTIDFDYRIAAKQAGYESERLEPAADPSTKVRAMPPALPPVPLP